MAHELSTYRTADEVEAIDTEIDPLPFAIDPLAEEYDRYSCGDPVILTSKDGAVFLGHLYDVEYDRLRIYVELD